MYTWNISVSNDGQSYSNQLQLTVYDSKCLDCDCAGDCYLKVSNIHSTCIFFACIFSDKSSLTSILLSIKVVSKWFRYTVFIAMRLKCSGISGVAYILLYTYCRVYRWFSNEAKLTKQKNDKIEKEISVEDDALHEAFDSEILQNTGCLIYWLSRFYFS